MDRDCERRADARHALATRHAGDAGHEGPRGAGASGFPLLRARVAAARGILPREERCPVVAFARGLAAVEVLGSTTRLCSDTTGTLTRDETTATVVCLPGRRRIEGTGAGYAPERELLEAGGSIDPARDTALLEAVALCNDAQRVAPDEHGSSRRALGDPTEAALLSLARKGGAAGVALEG